MHLQDALIAEANKAEGVMAAAKMALDDAVKQAADAAVKEAQRAFDKAAAHALLTREAATRKETEKRHLLKKAEAMEAEEPAASSTVHSAPRAKRMS